ncbi:MAG: MATE family efflux transporter [Ruminococcus sp.]|nr:MATE family efflux transporter [Ruminococcus sp.]
MSIQLSDHFTYGKLFRFTLPSIIMLVFTSVYGVVDGFFVSNYAGKTSFTAVNFIMPFLMILGCFGFMFGTGGGALIAKTLGEGKKEKANNLFSMIVYSSIIIGVILAVLGFLFIRPIARLLGADGELLENCVTYGRIILIAIPAFTLQYEFQCLFATAEKAQLGLYITIAAGLTNIVLDALFVGAFKWGLQGAAAATALSQCVGGIIPLIYFARPNSSLLQLGRFYFNGRSFLTVCGNGSSELATNISMSIVNMLYNTQLIKYAGEDGVAAYGVMMYVSMIFNAIFIGYSVGTSPAVSYNYGAENTEELKNLRKKSYFIIGFFAAVMFILAEALAKPLSKIFVGYDDGLLLLTLQGFMIFSFSFIFAGFVIFSSAFFTALNNGLVSALISFLRAFVFQISAVLILPIIWKVNGIWISIVVAEFMAVIVSVLFLIGNKKKYHY